MIGREIGKVIAIGVTLAFVAVGYIGAAGPTPTPTTPAPTPMPTTTNIPAGELWKIDYNLTTIVELLETYPDGQPKHAYIHTTTPGYENIGDFEIWWNSYGQTLKMVDYKRPLEIQGEWGLEKVYREELKWLESSDNYLRMPYYLHVYIDENGELVAYDGIPRPRLSIPSNKTPLPVPKWNDIKISARDYKRKMNVSSEYMFDVKNYDNITQWIYQQTPEYQQERIKKLESQLVQTQNQTKALNRTVEQHATWLDRILSWINQTFGVDLR